jgi:hypothetical protein
MKLKVLVIGFLLAALAGVWAQADVVGQVNFMQGDVQVTRDGAVLAAGVVRIGMSVENSDQFVTGANGQVEIGLSKDTGTGAVITMRPSSVAVIDISVLNGAQSGDIELLAGSIGLKVNTLTNGNKLNIHTESAVMGVRGTEFTVDTELDGEVLLQTAEGKVEITDDQGGSRFSVPGTIAQYDHETAWSTKAVAVKDQVANSQTWHAGRVAAFTAHPGVMLEWNMTQYAKLKTEFNETWERFKKQETVYRKWMREGTPKDKALAGREASAMRQDLAKLRQLALQLGRTIRRIDAAERVLGREKLEAIALHDGKKLGELLRAVRQDRAEQERRFADIQHIVKLFRQRSGGQMPRMGH